MNSNSPVSLGFVVSEWRQQQRMSQAELARRAGVNRQYLHKLEKDDIEEPGKDKLGRISQALGLHIEDITNYRLPGRQQSVDSTVGSVIDYMLNTSALSPTKRQQVSSQLITMTQGLVEVASAPAEPIGGD